MGEVTVYLDASALVPMFVIDSFNRRIETFLRTTPALIISDFSAAELTSTLARRVRMQFLLREGLALLSPRSIRE